MAQQIAVGIGEFIEAPATNTEHSDLRFCILLQSGIDWEQSVVVKNSHTKMETKVLIDYNNLSICCKFCIAVDHCFQNCHLRTGTRRAMAVQASTTNRHSRPTEEQNYPSQLVTTEAPDVANPTQQWVEVAYKRYHIQRQPNNRFLRWDVQLVP